MKIGQGSLQAWMRAGYKELAQALPAFPESIRPVEEPGLPGNLTSQEVYGQKHEQPATQVRQPEMEMDR